MRPLLALPQVAVEIEGRPLGEPAAALSEVRVRSALSVPAQCELCFREPPGPVAGAAATRMGAALRVTIGTGAEALFEGEVTAVEESHRGPFASEVRVRAYDVTHRLRKRMHLRALGEVTAGELAARLADELALSSSVEEQGGSAGYLIQHRQTDLELLTEVAARSGLYWVVRGATLRLVSLRGGGEEAVSLELGRQLHEVRIERNADRAAAAVHVYGWQPRDAGEHEAEVSAARSGRDIPARVSADQVGGQGPRDLVDQATADEGAARELAQGELDRRVAAEVVLSGVAEGDARLAPGAGIEVSGVGQDLAGRYVVTSVTHRVDADAGFTTEISTEPPVLTPQTPATGLTPGLVSGVDDPDGLGRVRVKLPAYGGVDTDWMEVLVLGAGRGKGLVILPGVGDRVLVALAGEDPGRGIVLGGLYGAAAPYDPGVTGGETRRYSLRTPGGHTVTLDDEARRLSLQDSGGSFLELTPDGVRLSSRVDLVITAPGKRILLSGHAIDFETA